MAPIILQESTSACPSILYDAFPGCFSSTVSFSTHHPNPCFKSSGLFVTPTAYQVIASIWTLLSLIPVSRKQTSLFLSVNTSLLSINIYDPAPTFKSLSFCYVPTILQRDAYDSINSTLLHLIFKPLYSTRRSMKYVILTVYPMPLGEGIQHMLWSRGRK